MGSQTYQCLEHLHLHPIAKLRFYDAHEAKDPLYNSIADGKSECHQSEEGQFLERALPGGGLVLQNTRPEMLNIQRLDISIEVSVGADFM